MSSYKVLEPDPIEIYQALRDRFPRECPPWNTLDDEARRRFALIVEVIATVFDAEVYEKLSALRTELAETEAELEEQRDELAKLRDEG